MELAYLKKLVRILEHSKVDEIEIEEEGLRIRVARNSHNNSSPVSVAAAPAAPVVDIASPSPTPATVAETKYHEIKSPIVGTFYRAPAPDADPYVEVGQIVQQKTVL